jgi:glycosyltransferase involved in cell wall biosynthesis
VTTPAIVPRVSVLITAFNHELFIAEAMESVLAQKTDFEYEIVAGDDCSVDRTRAILQEYERCHPGRVRLVLPDTNSGNHGNSLFVELMRTARGEYIAVLDGDDYWTRPDKLQRQVEHLDAHPACSLCFHNVLVTFEDGRKAFEYHDRGAGQLFSSERLWYDNYIASPSPVFRRAAVGTLPKWYESVFLADWALWLLVVQHHEVAYLDEVMAVSRKHDGGMWSHLTKIQRLEANVAFCAQVRRYLGSAGDRLLLTMAVSLKDLAIEHERAGALEAAARSLERCLAARRAALPTRLARPLVGSAAWLKWQLWLYTHPRLYGWRFRFGQLDHQLASHLRLEVQRRVRAVVRFVRGRSTGRLTAAPNPVPDQWRGLSETTLLWSATATDAVEVHIGGPDGPLFVRSGPEGRATTGRWVRDAMTFWLQDASRQPCTTTESTIDAIMIRVRPVPVATAIGLRRPKSPWLALSRRAS